MHRICMMPGDGTASFHILSCSSRGSLGKLAKVIGGVGGIGVVISKAMVDGQ